TANRLKNGGIVYKLNSSEAAQTIQSDEDARLTFMELYSAQATIKPRLYPIIVERVPISFNPESNKSLREMEDSNSIENGEIQRARWIKPVARREPNQRAAHLIVLLTNPRTANRMI
ncbi:hypothetical protein M422DRAFT_86757, partial [Sphaerobolus stellatus SS14]